MKKTIAKIMLVAITMAPMVSMLPMAANAAAPNWDASGNYVITMNYCSPGCADYAHDMSLTQDNTGALTGSGGYPTGGSPTYTWVVDAGSMVSGNTIYITAHYTASPDAVGTTLLINGTIASDGMMSGTWSDNYAGGSRGGTWTATPATAPLAGITTDPATGISSTDATLNGTNGNMAADGHSIWVSTSPFVTTSPTIPAGVYSTPDMGAIAANTPFSALLSSLTTSGVPSNMPAVTPNTTYYFAAWSLVNGTWHPGDVLSFMTSPAPQETVKVTIVKFIDGVMATGAMANDAAFPMSATWTAGNLNGGNQGTGSYTLSSTGYNNPTPYEATTSDMDSGASYTTNEVTDGPLVGAACTQTEGGPTYALTGYSTGDTLEAAQAADTTPTAPAFTNLTTDKFVIVHNTLCTTGSTGGGDLGGIVDPNNGVLHVDSITTNKGNTSADGTFAGGWKYTFHITAPTNEQNLAMKFSDWLSGTNTIPVANNMRISSAQADNAGATILLTAANTYSTPPLHMTGDIDAGTIGRQVDVVVEVSVPVGTAPGSYSTTYGVNTTP